MRLVNGGRTERLPPWACSAPKEAQTGNNKYFVMCQKLSILKDQHNRGTRTRV
jgi:hypothetical protein